MIKSGVAQIKDKHRILSGIVGQEEFKGEGTRFKRNIIEEGE